MVEQTKQRRITKKDWDNVAEFVKRTLKEREQDKFRKKHERIWEEVDRQVMMEPMSASNRDYEDKGDWHNVIELGELARASEIITADVMRLLFPNNRAWFEPHADTQQGPEKEIDNVLRAFMAQQHQDFGFKERLNLSVHEALHHGGFVAECDEEYALKIHDGVGVETMKAPVWKPHSLWNCYPDPSPSTLGTNTFYNGSMIIKEYIPLYLLKEKKGEGWMQSQFSKVKKKQNKNKDVETEDVELVKYFGDIVIERQDGDILLPNSEVILANDVIVYYSPSKLPYPRVIYNGYERLDVRDPYYVSPLIKTAPMHKMASKLANKTLDAVDLHVEPPIVYEGTDPNFVANGGPVIAPGIKSATKGMANYKEIKTGDPNTALNALTFVLEQIRLGTSVDAGRAGGQDRIERTAAESRRKERRGEVQVVDFVDKLDFSLKTFLYMQHEFNKKGMQKYSFYNDTMGQPDFMWMTRKDLPQDVHFDVVGAKGILGEEDRSQKMLGVVTMASANPLFANLLKPDQILKQAFMDSGVKNPEQFIKLQETNEFDAIVQRIQEEAQAVISEYEKQIFELEKKLNIQQAVNGARIEEARIKAESQAEISEYKAAIQGEIEAYKAELQAQLDILNTELLLAKSVGENSENIKSVKSVVGIINDVQKLVNQQNESIQKLSDEMDSKIKTRLDETDTNLKALMDKANKPLDVKIKEIKEFMRSQNG